MTKRHNQIFGGFYVPQTENAIAALVPIISLQSQFSTFGLLYTNNYYQNSCSSLKLDSGLPLNY